MLWSLKLVELRGIEMIFSCSEIPTPTSRSKPTQILLKRLERVLRKTLQCHPRVLAIV